ncbi:MAG: selenium-dependent molybdenum cofactor biosynthesis protein YqeB [Anaerolineales bacterium]|jgi:xanthine dehydrogenase accessory factor|nr:selenium-dependent molybdenum cofactor biosynthesis protein YqeB [Anaerolineales bacterium]
MTLILIRGGGDLASGVALRLKHAGLQVLISELEQPLAVRRAVSFCEAVYEGRWQVEEQTAERVETRQQIEETLAAGKIPVIVDPQLKIFATFNLHPAALIDARLLKHPPEPLPFPVPLLIGLGPGFSAGENCQAVIETQRGHALGRVYWQGSPNSDSGLPDGNPQRVLHAPANGTLVGRAQIGDLIEPGQIIAEVAGQPILAPFAGVLRGLIRPGLTVKKGLKVGDLDARSQPEYCFLASDKALAIGGAVLEAILSSQKQER